MDGLLSLQRDLFISMSFWLALLQDLTEYWQALTDSPIYGPEVALWASFAQYSVILLLFSIFS